jgi:serine/threonine protein phosphatase 1
MFSKLFQGADRSARVPEGERIYAIGDVHGCAALLEKLLGLIAEDSAGAAARLIFLGDYVDRGPDSKRVIDILSSLRDERPSTVFLMGNHERAMLDFLADGQMGAEWLHWGGDKTAESYGVADIWTLEPEETSRALRAAAPAAHLAFLEGLPACATFGDYIFVHAGLKPGRALADQTEEDMLWIRSEFHNAAPEHRPEKVVVHGHHPVKKPLDAGWRIDVDTGAVWTDRLTAVVLEGATRRFIST